MKLRHRLPALLLATDWLLFAIAFGWACKSQHNLLWWLRLDWTGWLGEFVELAQLGSVSASTLWILWLATSLLLTGVWLLYPAAASGSLIAAEAPATAPPRQLDTPPSMMDTHPDLKEKMMRLHQSLEKI